MEEKHTEIKIANYSEMLAKLVEEFDELLPESLTFEETLEVGKEAWNLANNKERINDKDFLKELKAHDYNDVVEKMVAYKLKYFAEHKNLIIDFSTDNDMLRVKSQTFQDYFDSLISKMVNTKPMKWQKKKKSD